MLDNPQKYAKVLIILKTFCKFAKSFNYDEN